MRVTVMFPDNTIGINGEFRSFASVPPNDSNWRVIQWYETYGNIEVYQGDRIWLNSIDPVEPYIEQWNSWTLSVSPSPIVSNE